MRDHTYFVYMLASGHYGTLYIGVTNDLFRRVAEHREALVPGFTRRYGVKFLVWYEEHAEIQEAIAREKVLKRWKRDWKITLLEADNPYWSDLYPALVGHGSRIAPLARPG